MRYRMALLTVLGVMIAGIVALVWSPPLAQRPGAAIDRVRFDTTGWNLHDASLASNMWKNADGDVLELKVVRETPDIVVKSDVALMRAEARRLAAGHGGSLLYADLFPLAGQKAGALIYKRQERPAYAYIGMLMIWTDTDHFVFSMASRERGTTGGRDAMVASRLIEEGKRVKGTLVDADAEEYDAAVPAHPLSKVRATLRAIQRTATLK